MPRARGVRLSVERTSSRKADAQPCTPSCLRDRTVGTPDGEENRIEEIEHRNTHDSDYNGPQNLVVITRNPNELISIQHEKNPLSVPPLIP